MSIPDLNLSGDVDENSSQSISCDPLGSALNDADSADEFGELRFADHD